MIIRRLLYRLLAWVASYPQAQNNQARKQFVNSLDSNYVLAALEFFQKNNPDKQPESETTTPPTPPTEPAKPDLTGNFK